MTNNERPNFTLRTASGRDVSIRLHGDRPAVDPDLTASIVAMAQGPSDHDVAVCDVCGRGDDHDHPEEFDALAIPDDPYEGLPGTMG